MESYTPEWPNKRDIVEAIRLARLVMVDANEVRQTSIECRRRAAALCKDAQRVRAASSTSKQSRRIMNSPNPSAPSPNISTSARSTRIDCHRVLRLAIYRLAEQ
jgi:hypothetical protein